MSGSAIPEMPDDIKVGLFYRASNGIDFLNVALDPHDKITDPHERENCRTLLLRALALLDADQGAAP